jgi:transposase
LATTVKDADQVRRLLALAAVYDGQSREEAARIGGMDRQTLRDWVHRFNEEGADGLINAKSPGRPPKLSKEQMEELRRLVEAGPDPEKDGVARWRRFCTRRAGSFSDLVLDFINTVTYFRA